MIREIKTENPEIVGFVCLLRLNGEDLEHGSL